MRSARCQHVLGWVGFGLVLIWLLFDVGFGLVGLADLVCYCGGDCSWLCLLLVCVWVGFVCWFWFCFGVGSAWLTWFGLAWCVMYLCVVWVVLLLLECRLLCVICIVCLLGLIMYLYVYGFVVIIVYCMFSICVIVSHVVLYVYCIPLIYSSMSVHIWIMFGARGANMLGLDWFRSDVGVIVVRFWFWFGWFDGFGFVFLFVLIGFVCVGFRSSLLLVLMFGCVLVLAQFGWFGLVWLGLLFVYLCLPDMCLLC